MRYMVICAKNSILGWTYLYLSQGAHLTKKAFTEAVEDDLSMFSNVVSYQFLTEAQVAGLVDGTLLRFPDTEIYLWDRTRRAFKTVEAQTSGSTMAYSRTCFAHVIEAGLGGPAINGFTNKSGQWIQVRRKDDESPSEAMSRVRARHKM